MLCSSRVRARLLLMSVFTLLVSTLSAFGNRTPPPDYIPLERLLAEANKFVAKKPEDAEGHYILGRIHHLAFLRGCEVLPVFVDLHDPDPAPENQKPRLPWDPVLLPNHNGDLLSQASMLASKKLGMPNVSPIFMEMGGKERNRLSKLAEKFALKLKREEWVPGVSLSWRDRFEHGEKAMKCFRDAIRLDPKASLYPLALARFAEDLDRTMSRLPNIKAPSTLERLSAREIRFLLQGAYSLATPPDDDWENVLKMIGQPEGIADHWTKDYFTYPKAGKLFVQVATRKGARLSSEERAFLARVRSGLSRRSGFDKRHPNW